MGGVNRQQPPGFTLPPINRRLSVILPIPLLAVRGYRFGKRCFLIQNSKIQKSIFFQKNGYRCSKNRKVNPDGHACAAGFIAGRPRHRSRGAEANGRLRARAGRAYEVAKGGAHAGAHVCAEHWATGRLVLDGDAVTPGQAERVARVTCGPTRRSSGLVGAVHPIDDDGALETEAEFRRGRSRPPTLACRRRRNALI